MAVMIRAIGKDDKTYYHGPFADEDQARGWGNQDLRGFYWEVEELIRPGSIYASCEVSDIEDFIQPILDKDRECYVTVNDVSWVVVK